MAKFPTDRFDGVPDDLLRVGAHRTGVRRHTGLIVFAWAALATGVLVAVGIGSLTLINNSFQFTGSATTATSGSASATKTATSTPTPTTAPITDPSKIDPAKTTITILNATTTAGLAGGAGTTLTNAGWTIGNEGNASSQVTTSVVYYDNSATDNKAIALGIAKTLGISVVQESTAFPGATITVVLGSDFSASS